LSMSKLRGVTSKQDHDQIRIIKTIFLMNADILAKHNSTVIFNS
jgi:hypothetical protein